MIAGRPRRIVASVQQPPAILFTDGACEPRGDSFVATIGGVLVAPGSAPRVFGCHVPADLVNQSAATCKHVIGQTELYAVLVARWLWAEYLNEARCIASVDHTDVHSACINGSSSDATWRTLLMHLEEADEAAPCLMWYHRVPIASNCADAPLRAKWDELSYVGHWTRDRPKCPISLKLLKDV